MFSFIYSYELTQHSYQRCEDDLLLTVLTASVVVVVVVVVVIVIVDVVGPIACKRAGGLELLWELATNTNSKE